MKVSGTRFALASTRESRCAACGDPILVGDLHYYSARVGAWHEGHGRQVDLRRCPDCGEALRLDEHYCRRCRSRRAHGG